MFPKNIHLVFDGAKMWSSQKMWSIQAACTIIALPPLHVCYSWNALGRW
jgi:hypothetical protein